MATLKQKWDRLLENSTALATVLILVCAALGLLVAVAIGVALAKVSSIIK